MLNEPLGLPKGSVRALVTLTLIAAAVYGMLTGIDVPEWYYAAVALIVGHYFGSRSTNGNTK